MRTYKEPIEIKIDDNFGLMVNYAFRNELNNVWQNRVYDFIFNHINNISNKVLTVIIGDCTPLEFVEDNNVNTVKEFAKEKCIAILRDRGCDAKGYDFQTNEYKGDECLSKRLTITNEEEADEFSDLLLNSLKYALGKITDVPIKVCNYIREHEEVIPDFFKQEMVETIQNYYYTREMSEAETCLELLRKELAGEEDDDDQDQYE